MSNAFFMGIKLHFNTAQFGLTDIGCIRETNEDAYLILDEKGIFIIADGMGGHKGGEVAARLAVETLARVLAQENDALKKAFYEANKRIYKEALKNESLSGMGTTAVALKIDGKNAYFGHVGDSRLYLFRDGNLEQLTSDHSLVAELIDMGALNKADAHHIAFRNILTKALGTHARVEPAISQINLQEKDLFLLCSDGLTNFVSDEDIESILKKDLSLEEQGKKLLELAKINGGGDNITLILIRVLFDLS